MFKMLILKILLYSDLILNNSSFVMNIVYIYILKLGYLLNGEIVSHSFPFNTYFPFWIRSH